MASATSSSATTPRSRFTPKRVFIARDRSCFPEVKGRVPFIGPPTRKELTKLGRQRLRPIAFRHYNAEEKVEGKTMREHFGFSNALWHFKGKGRDIFGGDVYDRIWDRSKSPMVNAERSLESAFEFQSKLGLDWCFHDRDLAPEGDSIAITNKNLEKMVRRAQILQNHTGSKLLWGTANLFSHPIYSSGAFTNPDPKVFLRACAQVRRAIDATVALGGKGYTFWGGREGYYSLLNTNMRQELDQLMHGLDMSVAYKKRVGLKGPFFIEPKPKEPTKHQYDSDAAACLEFLRATNLLEYFMLNIEANHATLAGHSFQHELLKASIAGKLGSVDANYGDELLGWDTDQFATCVRNATLAMLIVLEQGGLPGGFNFDAKLRRDSVEPSDLLYAHIGSMDAFALGLKIAAKIRKDGFFAQFLKQRYAGWTKGDGRDIMKGVVDMEECEGLLARHGEPKLRSGRQEMLEMALNDYVGNIIY